MTLPVPLSLALSGAVARSRRARAGTRPPKPSRPLSLSRGLAVRVTRRPVTALTLAVAVRIEAAARRTEREIGSLALGDLAFRTRKRRPDQRTMYRPFIGIGFGGRLGDGVLAGRLGSGFGKLERRRLILGLWGVDRFVCRLELRFCRVRWYSTGACIDQHAVSRTRLPAARGRRLRATVLVVRVARRAPRLLHRVINHRNDRVIRDTALARTIVVDNVTEPNPALRHEVPRSRFRQVGFAPRLPLGAP
jgi:hypothetical protein